MATYGQQVKLTGLVAASNLSAGQYCFVKAASTAGQVKLATSATSAVLGVLQNDPTAGQPADVCAYGETKVKAVASLTFGATITVNSSAYAAASQTTAGTVIVGRALEASATSGDLIRILVDASGAKY